MHIRTKFCCGIGLRRVTNINQMMHDFSTDLFARFCGANIHTPDKLTQNLR